jgi:electron-transferring-flavoprotein dehydrogenase
LSAYPEAYRRSRVFDDLYRVRNVKPGLTRWGTWLGTLHGGIHMWLNSLGLGFLAPWTLHHHKADNETLKPASACRPIEYPKPDGRITFDKLSSVFISNTNHEEDQPVHLKVLDMDLQRTSEHDVFAGPSNRYCPAGVYEWVEEASGPRFVINAQNCVHCKTCDVKDPNGNITWVPPEGGGGPNYEAM